MGELTKQFRRRRDALIVLVLAGGRSSERDVSLASGEAVRNGLLAGGHDVVSVAIGSSGRWCEVDSFVDEIDDAETLVVTPGSPRIAGRDVDVVFPVLHGPFGEDGVVQGLLESLDVPYVGSGVEASAVCMNKVVAKDVAEQHGIPQVRYGSVMADRWNADRAGVLIRLSELNLGWPVFVKPARLGSSVGIVRVVDSSKLEAAIDVAVSHDPVVIVEAASAGVEVECSVLGNHDPEVSEPGQIEFDGEWYDFEAKYEQGGMRLITPAPITDELRIRVQQLARQSFTLYGCRGLARADFFVQEDGQVLLNELNTLPGFTQTSVYAKLWEASGVAYTELLNRLLDLAAQRHHEDRSFTF